MVSTYRLQEQITGMMLGGATLDRVEAEEANRKAALWLWGLSYVTGTDQRAQANSYLAALK